MAETVVLSQFLTTQWQTRTYTPFRDGVDICLLRDTDPQVALLRYQPGASVPFHRHPGLEMIAVLEGAQSDDKGTYSTGDIVLNPPGSAHRVWSDDGCVVLILWERPVEILANPAP